MQAFEKSSSTFPLSSILTTSKPFGLLVRRVQLTSEHKGGLLFYLEKAGIVNQLQEVSAPSLSAIRTFRFLDFLSVDSDSLAVRLH